MVQQTIADVGYLHGYALILLCLLCLVCVLAHCPITCTEQPLICFQDSISGKVQLMKRQARWLCECSY